MKTLVNRLGEQRRKAKATRGNSITMSSGRNDDESVGDNFYDILILPPHLDETAKKKTKHH